MNNVSRFIVKGAWNNRGLHSSRVIYQNKIKGSVNQQVKVFEKLLGSKKSGSKRRWFIQDNEINPQKELANPTKISSTEKQGKSSNRRVAVLNKLFMKQITDLMATGSVSDEIVGRGIEISRVKVTPDFHGIDVYWISKGASNDGDIEKILHKCSGPLRHELSQLKSMGEVPRIRFVKDKVFASFMEVEATLRTIDFSNDCENYDLSKQTKNELNLETCEYATNTDLDNQDDEEKTMELLPVMRHDVLGLNHKEIMDKVLTKLKKSKQAWNKYNENVPSEEIQVNEKQGLLTKLEVKVPGSDEEEFHKFLQRRKYKKGEMDRNKEIKYDDLIFENYSQNLEDKLQKFDTDDDYIDESDNTK